MSDEQPEKKKRGRPKKSIPSPDVENSTKENKPKQTKSKGRPKGSTNKVNKANKKEKPLSTINKPLEIVVDGNKQYCPICNSRTWVTVDVEVAGEHCLLKFTKKCTTCDNYGYIIKNI